MRRFHHFLIMLSWVSAIVLIVLAGSTLAAPLEQSSLFERDLLDTRNRLELLATEVLGASDRPLGWTGNDDLGSETIVIDLWFDNELLADAIFGPGTRPDGWIGATTRDPVLLLRNVRHDLELSADQQYGDETRPEAWGDVPAIIQCSRTLQNLVYVLDKFYAIRPTVVESTLDYCRAVEDEIDTEFVAATLADPTIEAALPDQILAIRGDLERLADEELGLGTRPSGWIGSVDRNSPTLISDIFLDMETLADELLGTGIRPDGWIGFVSSSAAISQRNLRHDLELLADAAQGADVRPRGWQGTDPLGQCTPLQQNLVTVAQQIYEFTSLPPDSEIFCAQVEAAANQTIENPPVTVDANAGTPTGENRFIAVAEYAFAYLDVAATQYMGQVPFGTQFRAWYRNFGGSTMMFVSGEGFAVYIDLRWTTMSIDTFNALPSLEGVRPLTFCDAPWCNGPGPTPTPTGSGPLEQLLFAGTPVPTAPSAADLQQENLIQVSWNYIRVTYLLDNPATNTAQVALEICADTSQVACEPVESVFDNNTGLAKPVVSTYNGLNVYEFTYGYSTNVIIRGATRFSTDVWISDPNIR